MKKITGLFFTIVLMLTLVVPVNAATVPKTLTDKLAPYQEAIDRVNQELGTTSFIPKGSEQKVYDNIKNMSPEEFEQELKEDNERYLAESAESKQNAREQIIEKKVITPDSLRYNYNEKYPIDYNSYLYLKATVFAPGSSRKFTFESIHSYGVEWPSNLTDYHFEARDKGYSLNSARTECLVWAKGMPVNSRGVGLAVNLYAEHTFTLD
ncbi:MAG: hypothetical protein LKJ45_03335 [Oscillospiraceae bacterium]|jgi:hypothetical protein|nr:hypothetical protein [Oscillospiraceae bacterium]